VQEVFMTNQLLQHRVKNQATTIKLEQQRRTRQKALFKSLAEIENGGAIFYSPSKVEAAREAHAQKERVEVELEAQKSSRNLKGYVRRKRRIACLLRG
jgi:S-adenosylmethionine:tRNA-ribosyltransferase-isomerase (queuine synthetase)